jgi:hypothetical protein
MGLNGALTSRAARPPSVKPTNDRSIEFAPIADLLTRHASGLFERRTTDLRTCDISL